MCGRILGWRWCVVAVSVAFSRGFASKCGMVLVEMAVGFLFRFVCAIVLV